MLLLLRRSAATAVVRRPAAGAALGAAARRAMAALAAPELPYAQDALEPHISSETLSYHYGKHHMTYYNKLVAATEAEDSEWKGKSVEEMMMESPEGGPIFNNAAQIWNHNFYWKSLSPNGGGDPTGAVGDAINAQWGSFSAFKDDFSARCAGHFGSGWVWLVRDNDGKLAIVDTHDAGNPLRDGTGTPLLTCDVWEHAYYVDVRNARPEYVESWWAKVNWEHANECFAASS